MAMDRPYRPTYVPNPITHAALGCLVAGLIAGIGMGFAAAAVLDKPEPPRALLCEMPSAPAVDGIGLQILLDSLRRKGGLRNA